MTICPLCQTRLAADEKVCHACGTTLDTVTITPNGRGQRSELLPVGTLLGSSYIIKSVLGHGGFGITYKCRDQMLEREVAVKEFFPFGSGREGNQVRPSRALSPLDYGEAKSQFLEEARLLARCHHVGIVNVHTAFEQNNSAYMVMELLHGKNLGALLQERGVMDEAEAVGYIERVGDALQFVHELGLLHRDLKPENMVVCDDGRVMLIDFGTAREYSKGQVQGHTIVVTPGYAPLEQYAQHAQRGAFTDVYGLAATLYHLLTGQIPTAASDRAMGVRLSPVRELNAKVSPTVAAAIEAGLQTEIARRPQSVREFLDLLHGRIFSTQSPQAPQDTIKAASFDEPSSGWEYHDTKTSLDVVSMIQAQQSVQAAPAAMVIAATPNSISPQTLSAISPSATPQRGPLMAQRRMSNASSFVGSLSIILGLGLVPVLALVFFGKTTSNRPAQTTFTVRPQPSINPTQPNFAQPQRTTAPPKRSTPNTVNNRQPSFFAPDQKALERVTSETGAFVTRPQQAQIPLQDQSIIVAKFSPDAKLAAMVTRKQTSGTRIELETTPTTARIWDVENRRALRSFDLNVREAAQSYNFSDDLRWLAIQDTARLRVWDLQSGRIRHEWERTRFPPGAQRPYNVSELSLPDRLFFLQDGRVASVENYVVSDTGQKRNVKFTVFFFDLQSGEKTWRTIPDIPTTVFQAFIWSVTVSPDGRFLASGMKPDSIELYALTGPDNVQTIPVRSSPFPGMYRIPVPPNPMSLVLSTRGKLQYSPDGKLLAFANAIGTVQLFAENNKEPVVLPAYSWRPRLIRSVYFSQDEQWLAASSLSEFRIWNTKNGKLVHYKASETLANGQSTMLPLRDIAFTHGALTVVGLNSKGQVLTWRRRSEGSQKPPKELLTRYEGWKKAYTIPGSSAPKPDPLAGFYIADAKFKPTDGTDSPQSATASMDRIWGQVYEENPPLVAKLATGWVMHCRLSFGDSQNLVRPYTWRRLLWVRNGNIWRIREDTPSEYRDAARQTSR